MEKVFIYGNKNNPEGVKKALERHGVDCSTPFQESFRKALADPHTILFNGTDAYGKPGHVGWYKDDNLACVPMVYHEEGWIQISQARKRSSLTSIECGGQWVRSLSTSRMIRRW